MAMARRAEAVPVNANAAEHHNGIARSRPAWLWVVPGSPIRMLVKVVGPAVAAGFVFSGQVRRYRFASVCR